MTASLSRTRGMRVRIAGGVALVTLLIAAAVSIATVAFIAFQNDPHSDPRVGAARVGTEVVVIVADENPPATVSPTAILKWSLLVLALSAVPAVTVGWVLAGRMLRTVDQALDDVDVAERERDRRLQEVVHELRTPLAVIGTNLELAATGSKVDRESASFIDAALRALGRMDRTVGDLAGHSELVVEESTEPIDLADVAAGVVNEFSGPARRRGVHLVTGSTAPLEVVSAQLTPLRTVLGNLIANAVRLAPQGSVVTVDWDTHADWAWVAVNDEGPGLPERHHARVFERGWRGPNERHRGDDGAGLGLTIARQLTEAQGGALTLTSQEGVGSTFAVWLPRTADAAVTEVVAHDGVHPLLAGRSEPATSDTTA